MERKRVLYVTLGHLLLLIAFYCSQTRHPPLKPHLLTDRHYVILATSPTTTEHQHTSSSTPTPNPPKPTVISNPQSPKQPSLAPAQTKPKPSNPKTPKTTQPKSPPKPKTSSTPEQVGAHEALAHLLEKSLQNLESTPPKTPTSLTPSKLSLGPLHCERTSQTYQEQLIAFLEDLLTFPEPGDVVVEIKVTSSGKVISCKVLESPSSANELYVVQTLSRITLPSFFGAQCDLESKILNLKLVGSCSR